MAIMRLIIMEVMLALAVASAFVTPRASLTPRRPLLVHVDSSLVVAANEALPDPRIPVIGLGFIAVAFVVTQLSVIGVVDDEDKLGAEAGRKAREQMARRRGYFRDKK